MSLSVTDSFRQAWKCAPIMRSIPARRGAVAELVGIECGVVSGVFNLESTGIEAPAWRPRHDKHYHEAVFFAANVGDGC